MSVAQFLPIFDYVNNFGNFPVCLRDCETWQLVSQRKCNDIPKRYFTDVSICVKIKETM